MQRAYSTADNLIAHADRVLRTLAGHAKTTGRENPSDAVEDNDLNEDEAKLSAQLMRVNHAGEVAAQALYQGQSLTARNKAVQEKLTQAAEEENDHLVWCDDSRSLAQGKLGRDAALRRRKRNGNPE